MLRTACTSINAPGTYTLTADVIDHNATPCLQLTASNVVLDGDGHTVDGVGNGTGIRVVGDVVNVTVRNVVVTDWESGVRLESADGGRLEAIVATNNTYGVDLQSSNTNTLDGISASNNDFGARLGSSHNNDVADSAFMDNAHYGVHQSSATGNTFTNVTVAANAVGLLLDNGHTLAGSVLRDNSQNAIRVTGSNNVIERNTIANNGLLGISLATGAGSNGANVIADNRLNNTANTNVGGFTADPDANDWNVTPTTGTNIDGGDTVAGNLWLRPDGTGFSQTCTDADVDGLCDDPNQLDADNVDHHPLAAVNAPPTAAFTYDPSAPRAGDAIQFTAQASDSDGTIATYAWDFDDDGTTDATAATPTHTFAAVGDYPVTLTVTDDEDAANTTTVTISVVDPDALTSCTVIDSGGTYRLAENLTVSTAAGATCFDVQASDVRFDGAGYTLENADGARQGFAIATGTPGLDNVTVSDVAITNWNRGVALRDQSSATLANVSVTDATTAIEIVGNASGVVRDASISGSSGSVQVGDGDRDQATGVLQSSLVDSAGGLRVGGSAALIAEGNTINRTDEAIHLGGEALTARGNTIVDASIGIAQWGGTATIENNTIRNADEEGLLVAVGTAAVTNNTVERADVGIAVYAGTGPVTNNTVKGVNDAGIVLRSTDSTSPGDLVASGNAVTDADTGIRVHTNATVTANTVGNASQAGIELAENATALVSANHLERSFFGISAADHAVGEFRDNTVNATFRGFELGADGVATIAGNRITNASDDGVSIWGASTVTVTGNVVDEAGNMGIHVLADDAATVSNNTVRATVDDGIFAGADALTVSNNTVTTAGDYGVALYPGDTDPADVTVAGNVISATPESGIFVATNATVENNSVTTSGSAGIEVGANLTAVVRSNQLDGHLFGVNALEGTTVTVTGNQIDETQYGIHLGNAATAVVNRNVVTEASDTAIVAWGGDRFEAVGNVVEGGGGGIGANTLSVSATISNNTVRNAGRAGIYATAPQLSITDNTVRSASTHGLLVSAGSTPVNGTVAGNHVQDISFFGGPGDGLHLANVTVTARNNTVVDTAGTGLNVTAGSSVTLENNDVTAPGASQSGIRVTDATATLRANAVDGASRPDVTGIRLDGAEATFRENTVTDVHTGLWTDVPFSVQFNAFVNTTVAFENTHPSQTLDATLNYLGPRGTLTTDTVGDVTAEPFLTAPPAAINRDHVQSFGYSARMPMGSIYALGAAAPLEGDLASVFNDFEGAIYVYDSDEQSWELATGDETFEALEAVVVVPTSNAAAILDYADATVASPTEREFDESGWQFVAPRSADDAETAFSSGTVGSTDLLQLFAPPVTVYPEVGESFGRYHFTGNASAAPEVSPFTGYFVYVDEPGAIPGSVPRGVTVIQIEQLLGIQP